MTTTKLNICDCLNKMLVWNLDNHDQEYNKLYKIGTKELKELLELEKKEYINAIIKRFNSAKLYDTWLEHLDKEIKYNNTQEQCKLYIEWYNKAVWECNRRVDDFCEYFEEILNKL